MAPKKYHPEEKVKVVAKVIWVDTMFTLVPNKSKWMDNYVLKLYTADGCPFKLEIIGNIYESPELLK